MTLFHRSVALTVLLLSSASVAGGDWPQILGPQRNGIAKGEQLATNWPAGGPRTMWSVKVGSGYAGPAVVGERVLFFHRVANQERIEARRVDTGASIWQADFPASYAGGINSDKGPRCVPLIHKGKVYAFGATGDLHCVALADGKKLWSRSLYRDYGGLEGYFGAGSTPVAVGPNLLVNVGGRDTAGFVALDLGTGKTKWKRSDERASYSSPTVATLHGKQQVIFLTRANVVSVNAENGQEFFRFSFGRRGPTVNAATPLIIGSQLFVSASYGVGARLEEIGKSKTRTIWSNDESLSSQYNTAVYHDGHLYGTHGREDGAATYRCVEAKTGTVKWSSKNIGVANSILAGGHLLTLTYDGTLTLLEASPNGPKKLAEATVGRGITRALPALSNGRFFFRINQGGSGELKCLVVGK